MVDFLLVTQSGGWIIFFMTVSRQISNVFLRLFLINKTHEICHFSKIYINVFQVKAELDDSRNELKRVREAKKEEKKRLADEDAQRRIRQLEETCSTLQKQVANHKQEEEALLSEMEVTGQAFEDMQEQNSRLIQQLREKDDANFKLMSERIKSNQVECLLKQD